nr:DUF1631 family protein [Halorhodospira abdelmalekii]
MAARLPRLYAIVEQLLTVSAAATPHELPAGSAPSGRAAGAASDPVARAAQSHQRVEQGRARVQREIERCLQGVELPEVVVRLLREPWARLLLWAYISDGPESELWVHHCAVMERLVWSFRVAAEGGRARQRLALEIPVLLHELTDGLHGVLHDPFELADLLRTLEEEYVRCLTANDPLLVSVSAAANDSIEAKQSSSTTGRAVTSQTLERLPEGTWLELSSASGEPLRLRLAGRSEEGGLVFSNRAGFKVLERSPQQLAAAVASGEAKLLNDAQLFSDGLSQVMRSLVERRIGHGDELASDD